MFFLRPFYKNLQFKIAQTIFADNRVHHIGKLNYNNTVNSFDLGLIHICKNFSLPMTILNQNFEIVQHSEEPQPLSSIHSDVDVLISFLNISHLNYDERYELVKQMQQYAPKALFIEYENPERNIAYPMFYSFILGAYASAYGQQLFTKYKRKEEKKQNTQNTHKRIENIKEFLKNGALEGFIYDIPTQTGIQPKVIEQTHLYCGGLGFFYCEW